MNLTVWEPPAREIKLLNGINNSHGTWQGDTVSFEKTAVEIARSITDIVQGHSKNRDNLSEEIPLPFPETENSVAKFPLLKAPHRLLCLI